MLIAQRDRFLSVPPFSPRIQHPLMRVLVDCRVFHLNNETKRVYFREIQALKANNARG
jgi:hypothetical protein